MSQIKNLSCLGRALELGIEHELHDTIIARIVNSMVEEFKEKCHAIVSEHVRKYTIGNIEVFHDNLIRADHVVHKLYYNGEEVRTKGSETPKES